MPDLSMELGKMTNKLPSNFNILQFTDGIVFNWVGTQLAAKVTYNLHQEKAVAWDMIVDSGPQTVGLDPPVGSKLMLGWLWST